MDDDGRNPDFDLHWEPVITGSARFKVEYVHTVSPMPGAHLIIDVPLPGAAKVTVIVENQEGAVT